MKGQKQKNIKKMSKLGSKSNLQFKAKNRNKQKIEENTTTSTAMSSNIPFRKSLQLTASELKAQKEQRRKQQQENIQRPRNTNLKFKDLMVSVEQRNMEYESKMKWQKEEKASFTDRSAKAYYKEFKKVVDEAHVILQVLDARDPLGTRCIVMEELVKSHQDKRLILILNKADLVPRSNLEEWIKYLKNFYPTLLFKASTQSQSKNIAQISKRALTNNPKIFQTQKCIGADTLMQLLKNYSRNNGMKTAIVVGVVGMPNVGKSSIINSLKRSKSCNTGATPGITKTMQEIILDSKVRLLDCPGVIFPGANTSDAVSSLRNALRIDDLTDFITPIEAIIEKAGAENLRKYYDLGEFSNVDQFLSRFAAQKNKLGRGGIPDINAAAKNILHDWNTGKIKYFTVPPKEINLGQATIVSSLAKEFQFDDLDSMNDMDSINDDGMDCVNENFPDDEDISKKESIDNAILPADLKVELIKDEVMEKEEPEKKARWETERQEIDFSNINLKKFQQKISKKNRKERNRNVKRTDSLIDAFENLF